MSKYPKSWITVIDHWGLELENELDLDYEPKLDLLNRLSKVGALNEPPKPFKLFVCRVCFDSAKSKEAIYNADNGCNECKFNVVEMCEVIEEKELPNPIEYWQCHECGVTVEIGEGPNVYRHSASCKTKVFRLFMEVAGERR